MLSPSQIQTLEELDKWQGVIDVHQKWCKGAARIGNRRCLVGAACAAFGHPVIDLPIYRLVRDLVGDDLAEFNDSYTHADVMALFERVKEKVRNS